MEGGEGYAIEDVACDACEKGLVAGEQVIRMRYGEMRERKWGIEFLPYAEGEYTEDLTQWFHRECFEDAAPLHGVVLEKCCCCGGEFRADKLTESQPTPSTVLEFTEGYFSITPGDPRPEFKEKNVGAIHWACGLEDTALPIWLDEEPLLDED